MKNINNKEIEKYCIEKSTKPSDIANSIESKTKETFENNYMLIGKLEASFLGFLTRLIGAKRILEIGTFTSYSALIFAENIPDDGVVHTLDKNIDTVEFGKKICKSSKHAYKINYHIGNALETINTIDGNFDIIFIDADKENYIKYFKLAAERLNPDGIIILDNCLWYGQVIDSSDCCKEVIGIREVNDFIEKSNEFYATLLPIRDGIFIVKKYHTL